MRGDPDCHYCDGSGLRDDTLGKQVTCFCTWDVKWRKELEDARTKKQMAELLEKEQVAVCDLDWDLF